MSVSVCPEVSAREKRQERRTVPNPKGPVGHPGKTEFYCTDRKSLRKV